ncbi:unnamed protein product [Cuscuta campestris]|uniref:Uncharacterized protein n=1 Tax=Cuscuta campestris TaxID=132261 RepID=A0A484NJG4_9ASTE|nr:unnamed protein product [Cuscuta campestris]
MLTAMPKWAYISHPLLFHFNKSNHFSTLQSLPPPSSSFSWTLTPRTVEHPDACFMVHLLYFLIVFLLWF